MTEANLINIMQARLESEQKEHDSIEIGTDIDWAKNLAVKHGHKRVIDEIKFYIKLLES